MNRQTMFVSVVNMNWRGRISPNWRIVSTGFASGQTCMKTISLLLLMQEVPVHCRWYHAWEGGINYIEKISEFVTESQETVFLYGLSFSFCLLFLILSSCHPFPQWWTVTCKTEINSFLFLVMLAHGVYHSRGKQTSREKNGTVKFVFLWWNWLSVF